MQAPIKTKNKDKDIANRALELKEWITQIDLIAAKTEKTVGVVKLKYLPELYGLRETSRRIEKLNEQVYTSDAWGINVFRSHLRST